MRNANGASMRESGSVSSMQAWIAQNECSAECGVSDAKVRNASAMQRAYYVSVTEHQIREPNSLAAVGSNVANLRDMA
jgi:hypothetical protein